MTILLSCSPDGGRHWIRGYRGSRPGAHHGSLLERVKNFYLQAFSVLVFEFTGFLPSRQETTKRSGVLLHEVLGLALGLSVPIPVACSLAPGVPPLWAKALCVCKKALTAGWWTTRRPSQGLRS